MTNTSSTSRPRHSGRPIHPTRRSAPRQRGGESTLGNFVADVQLWAASVDGSAEIAFMNPGGLRTDILFAPDGAVTYREAANVQPFANTLVTMTLTGAQAGSTLIVWAKTTSSVPVSGNLSVSIDGVDYGDVAYLETGRGLVKVKLELPKTLAKGLHTVTVAFDGTSTLLPSSGTVVIDVR